MLLLTSAGEQAVEACRAARLVRCGEELARGERGERGHGEGGAFSAVRGHPPRLELGPAVGELDPRGQGRSIGQQLDVHAPERTGLVQAIESASGTVSSTYLIAAIAAAAAVAAIEAPKAPVAPSAPIQPCCPTCSARAGVLDASRVDTLAARTPPSSNQVHHNDARGGVPGDLRTVCLIHSAFGSAGWWAVR